MTRVSGKSVFKTPCCGALYTRPNYSSINLSAKEFWTDGRTVNSLAPNDWGLRKCGCGQYYIDHKCERLYTLKDLKSPAPDGWEIQNWWTRFKGKPTREYYEKHYDTRPKAEREAHIAIFPSPAVHVNDEELKAVIDSKPKDKSLEIIARRRYWQFLNDPYRVVYREYKKKDERSYPPYIASDEIQNNIETLIQLLTEEGYSDNLEMADLYRQSGDFESARAIVGSVVRPEDEPQKVAAITELIKQGRQGPAWYMLGH